MNAWTFHDLKSAIKMIMEVELRTTQRYCSRWLSLVITKELILAAV